MKNYNEQSEFDDINEYIPYVDLMKRTTKAGISIANSYVYYFNMICLLAQTAYKWKNLPKEIPPYYIEKTLFNRGAIGFTYDDVVSKYIALPCVNGGKGLDIYGEPIEIKLYSATNEYNILCKNKEDAFVCYNNAQKQPSINIALRYAKRLQMIDDIIDINIKGQKTPYIVVCNDQKQLKTIKNILNKIDNNIDQLITAKDFTNELKTLDLKCELKADKLLDIKKDIFNEACLYLGITGVMPLKKERLITAEVENEENRYGIYREIGLRPRQYFCELVNEKYNLDLQVEYAVNNKQLEEIQNAIVNKGIDTDKEDIE